MNVRQTSRPPFGGGLSGPIPRDLLVIGGLLLLSVTLASFAGTRIVVQLLTITSAVWQRGFLWQIATYLFVDPTGPSLWFVVNLVLLFLWGRDVYWGLGRRHFWRLLLASGIGAAVLATLVDLLTTLAGGGAPTHFFLMQSWTLMAILLAAWARAHRGATILFMFILPIEAGWLIALEILLAFLGFLRSGDLPGFVGLCAAIGISWGYIARGGRLGLGKRDLREVRLRLERWWIQRKLNRAKKKRNLRVIPGERKESGPRRGPWVN